MNIEDIMSSTDTVFPGGKSIDTGKDLWTFVCPMVMECNGGYEHCMYLSTGWTSSDSAKARGLEHIREHITGEQMTPEVEFLIKHGERDRSQ